MIPPSPFPAPPALPVEGKSRGRWEFSPAGETRLWVDRGWRFAIQEEARPPATLCCPESSAALPTQSAPAVLQDVPPRERTGAFHEKSVLLPPLPRPFWTRSLLLPVHHSARAPRLFPRKENRRFPEICAAVGSPPGPRLIPQVPSHMHGVMRQGGQGPAPSPAHCVTSVNSGQQIPDLLRGAKGCVEQHPRFPRLREGCRLLRVRSPAGRRRAGRCYASRRVAGA